MMCEQQATYIYDWGFAAAISVIFLIVSMIISNSGKLYDLWQARKAARSEKLLRTAVRGEGENL